MKAAFENLTYGVYRNSAAHVFLPSDMAKEILFYPECIGHYYCSSDYYIKYDSGQRCLLQIMYIVSGNLFVSYRNKSFTAKEGDIVLLDCSEYHYYRADENLEFYFYGFDGSNSKQIFNYILETQGVLINSKNNIIIGNFIKSSLDYYEENTSENPFDASMRIYKILNLLLQRMDAFSISKSEPVEQSINYINDHLKAKITMEQLAKMVNLSPSYFSHLFKSNTGYSPRDYITNARMNKAKLLLAETNKSISEIAYAVGYVNGVSFTNVFTEKIGCSPKNFRYKYLESMKNLI